MPQMTEKEFISVLKATVPYSVYLFYGEDEYSKNICYRKLLKTVSPNSEPTFFDGENLDITRLQEECNSVSFFCEDKCVLVRNPAIESFSAEMIELIDEVIKNKPDSTAIIFMVKGQAINTRTDKKWAKFIDKINKVGAVIECKEKSKNDVVSMIISTAKKSGCAIERTLADNLADRCLNDMLILENDLVKLCAFAAEKTDGIITQDAIENLTAQQLDFKTYEITKHIISKNAKTALHILNSLFLQQVDAIAINSALAGAFLDIYRVKMMQQYNHSQGEISANFDYKGKDFKLKIAGYDAPKCSLEFLKNAITVLSDADITLKSTKDDKKLVMEKAILNIISGKKL